MPGMDDFGGPVGPPGGPPPFATNAGFWGTEMGAGPISTTQVTIPKDLTGTIMGKGESSWRLFGGSFQPLCWVGGERINRIRDDTG